MAKVPVLARLTVWLRIILIVLSVLWAVLFAQVFRPPEPSFGTDLLCTMCLIGLTISVGLLGVVQVLDEILEIISQPENRAPSGRRERGRKNEEEPK